MNWKESTYLKERQYESEMLCTLDSEQINYWQKVVGVSALEDFFKDNNLDKPTILCSETYKFDKGKFE